MDTSEISNTSLEDAGDGKRPRKHKKRSLVERELETNLTARITSPLIADSSPGSRSRYGRALKINTDNQDNGKEVPKLLKSPQNEITPVKMLSSISSLHESPIEERIEMIYKQNISLSRFKDGVDCMNKDKVYMQKDLIQNDINESKSKSSHLNNILERSSEKYSLSKNYDVPSVVKVIDFEQKKFKDMKQKELLELESTCEYQVCDMAWARVGAFPFWPCIVSRDPYTDFFVKKKAVGKGEQLIIHVIFFGDNGRRGWVSQGMLRKFEGIEEFENAKQQLTPELKKKDPKLYAAFSISEKRQQKWKLSVEEAELIYNKEKNYRLDVLSDMLIQNRNFKVTPNKKETLGKISRKSSDVSLSESLYDTLFSEDDSKAEDSDPSGRKHKKALDVSEVVTACLDDMAAKTGLTDIKKQSHMDRWLQKAKSKTPEKNNSLSFSKEKSVSATKSKQKKTSNKVDVSVSDVNCITETSKEEETSKKPKKNLKDNIKLPKRRKKEFSQTMNDFLSTENELIQNILIGELTGDSFIDIDKRQMKEIETTESSDSCGKENTATKKQIRKNKVRKQATKNVSHSSLTPNTSVNESNGTIDELLFNLTSDSVPSIESPIVNKKVTKNKIVKSTPKRSKRNALKDDSNKDSDTMSSSVDFNSTGDENVCETTIESITDQGQDINNTNESVISNEIKSPTVVKRLSKKRNQVKNENVLKNDLIKQGQIIKEPIESSENDLAHMLEISPKANENKQENIYKKTPRRSSRRYLASTESIVKDKSVKANNDLSVSEIANIKTKQTNERKDNISDKAVLRNDESSIVPSKPSNINQEEKSIEIIDQPSNKIDQNYAIQVSSIIIPKNDEKSTKSNINGNIIKSTPRCYTRRDKSLAEENIKQDELPIPIVNTNSCHVNGVIENPENGKINENSINDIPYKVNSSVIKLNDINNLILAPSLTKNTAETADNVTNKPLEKLTNGHHSIEYNSKTKLNAVREQFTEFSVNNLSISNIKDLNTCNEVNTNLNHEISEPNESIKNNSTVSDVDSETELFFNKSPESPRTYKKRKKGFMEEMPTTLSIIAPQPKNNGDVEEECLQSCDESILSNESPEYDSDEDIQLSYSPLSALGDPDRADTPDSVVYTMDYGLDNDFVENNKNEVNECPIDEIRSDVKNQENGRNICNSKETDSEGIVMNSVERVRSDNSLDCITSSNKGGDMCKDLEILEKSNGIRSKDNEEVLNELCPNYTDPNFLKYVELKQDSLLDENPELSQKDILKYLSETWKYEKGLKSTEKQVDKEEQTNITKISPKVPSAKTPKTSKSTRQSIRNNKKLDDFDVVEKLATRSSKRSDTKTGTKMGDVKTSNNFYEDKTKIDEPVSKINDVRNCLENVPLVILNDCFNKNIDKNEKIDSNKKKDNKITIKSVETINLQKTILEQKSSEKQIEDAFTNKDFLNYVEINRDALLDENPELDEKELMAYLYKTWSYEMKIKSKSSDNATEENCNNICNKRSEFDKEKLEETSTSLNSTNSEINGTKLYLETDSVDKVKANKVKINKNYDNPEFLKYVEIKQDSLLDENPSLTQDDLLAYLFKTWSYEQELKTDDMKMNDKKESTLIKGLDESKKPKSKKKKARKIRRIHESSDEDSDFEVSPKSQRLSLKKKITNKANGLISWLNKEKDDNTTINDLKKSNEVDTEENINSKDIVPAINTIESTEVLVNGINDTVDIRNLGSPVIVTEIKTKKTTKSLSYDDPEFLKYVELRQDALIDEFPELSADEIMQYLFKTWSYEEKLKSDEVKNDDLQQSNLVKGLGDDTSYAPTKKVHKKKIDKKHYEFYDSDSTIKEKPKRKAATSSYYMDFDSFSDSDGLDNLDDNGRPLVYSKSRDSGENSESIDEEGVIKDIEYFFYQMTQPKPNIFKGLVREKVCEICEMTNRLVKCISCAGMFHIDCVKNQAKIVIEQSLGRGRKKKKTKGKKSKEQNDSEGSDEKNNSVDEDDKSLEDLNTLDLGTEAEEFESKIQAKMKEIINLDVLYDSQYTSEEELDWDNMVAGQCEIVDFKLKQNVIEKCYGDFKCNSCQKHDTPLCFVCKGTKSPKSGVELRQKCSVQHCNKYYHMDCLDHWPQTHINSGEMARYSKKPKQYFETFTCPRHVCHTCVCDDPRGCKTRFSADKLAKCVRCPAVYHSFTKCLPAGTKVLTASHIICPRHYEHKPGKVPCHVNTGWCFICALGGTLICCEYCPMSFHAECLNIKPPEGGYMCEDCETGRLPLYGEMVWVKLGNYRWWPGLILHPSEIPDNVLSLKHYLGEFVIRFFGQYDHYWVNRGRVFPFQEGDSGKISSQKNKIDAAFTRAMEDAQRACEVMKTAQPNHEESMDIQSSLLAPHYIKLKVNKPCGSLINWKPDDSEANSLTQCECDPNDIEPCGPDSQCLNRMLLTECGPTCRAGDRCFNRNFEKRIYPKMVAYRTSYRGWGLKTLEPIKKGQFVIEYVGELIDEEEFRRRMKRKHEIRDENFYFLTLDKDRIIDAGPKGNLARFMNHCCDPNCETQKWTVLGDVRVGLFAIEDIPANTEVNFNYNFECAGIEKKQCMCGAKRCSGYIGAKPKQLQEGSQTKRVKLGEKQKRVYKKRKNNTESPTTSKKGRTKTTKPRHLTEIEKDLMIIKSASSGLDSEVETYKDSDSDKKPMKRKRVNFSTEERNSGEESPLLKKQKIDSVS